MSRVFMKRSFLASLLVVNIGCSSSFLPPTRNVLDGNPTRRYNPCISMAVEAETETKAAEENQQKEEIENPRLVGLAFMLDDGTKKSHSLAQNSEFVSGFFKGLSTRDAYRTLLTSLYFVYEAMEEAFDETTLGAVKALDDDELRRLPSLEKDMDFFYGSEWRDVIRASPATRAYVARIRDVAETRPYLLVAHQYTRYLGDLFGGQMMSGMASRSLSLGEGEGVAFYTFEDIPSAKDFITDWYSRLNALDLTEDQKNDIVDEANFVFDLNIGILRELDGSPLRALWTLAVNTLKLKLGLATTTTTTTATR